MGVAAAGNAAEEGVQHAASLLRESCYLGHRDADAVWCQLDGVPVHRVLAVYLDAVDGLGPDGVVDGLDLHDGDPLVERG